MKYLLLLDNCLQKHMKLFGPEKPMLPPGSADSTEHEPGTLPGACIFQNKNTGQPHLKIDGYLLAQPCAIDGSHHRLLSPRNVFTMSDAANCPPTLFTPSSQN